MTLPPHGSQHYEVRRRIAGCRERLRRNRTAQRELERAGPRGDADGKESAAAEDDDAEGDEQRTRRSPRR